MNWCFLTTRGNFTQIFGSANYVVRAQSLSIKLYPIHHNDFVNNRIVWSGKWKALFLSEEPGTKVVLENSLKVDKNQLWQIPTQENILTFLAKSSSHSRGAFTFERGHATPSILATRMAKSCGRKKGGRFNNSSGDLELSTEESQMTWKRTRIKEVKHIVICARTTYVVFSTLAFLFWNLCKLNCSVYNLFLKYSDGSGVRNLGFKKPNSSIFWVIL